MKLQDWLNRHEKSRREFAEAIGVDEISVGRYITGARYPRRDVMARIKAETGGEVTADDFVPEVEVNSAA